MDNTSKRATKKLHKKHKEKEILHFRRELYNIYDQIRQLGYVKLDKPYKKGYKKSFRLKKEYAAWPDYKNLIKVLDYINYTTYSPVKDFSSYCYYVSLCHEPRLNRIPVKVFETLPSDLKKYFKETKCTSIFGTEYKMYEIRHPEYYEIFVCRHIVTKVRKIDPELEKRKAELENYIKANNLWPKISKLIGIPTSGGKNRVYNNYHKKAVMEKLIKKDLEMYFDIFEE